jgi:hypothetical protein
MEVTLYGVFFREHADGNALTLSFDPIGNAGPMTVQDVGGNVASYPADTSKTWIVAVPPGSVIKRGDGPAVLETDFKGRRTTYTAGKVFALAKESLHGFRVTKEPD